MPPVVHDKGIARLSSFIDTEKGKWYFGFICKECGAKIFSLTDPTQGEAKAPIAIGAGQFSVPCRTCGIDEIIYETADLIPVQADKDARATPALPRRTPSNSGRQKLSNRYPKAKATFGPRYMEDRPECAVIIARCSAIWSYVEYETALLLATILKINTEPALAMFLAMQSTRTQIDVLSAAAETALAAEDFKLFQAVMNLRKVMEGHRNHLIHGLFGGSLMVKDGVLWTEQKNLTRHTTTVWGTNFSQMKTKYLDEVFVYEAADLEAVAQNLEWLYEFMGSFRAYIGSKKHAWRAERYRQLCAEPRVQAELDRMSDLNKGQKNNPSTQPR